MLPIRKWRFDLAVGALFGGHSLKNALDLLVNGRPWPFDPEPGDDPLPGGDPVVIDPPKPLGSNPPDIGAYNTLCVRFDIEGWKRDKIMEALPLIRVCQWSQRRSEADTIETLVERMVSMSQMSGERRIFLGMDWFEALQPGYAGGGDAQRWARLILAAMKPYWGRVCCVECCDEPEDAEMLAVAARQYRVIERSLGLEPKPLSVTVCRDPHYIASIPEIDILAIEAYAKDPAEANTFDDATAQGKIILGLEAAALAVRETGKKLALVSQTYARNPHPVHKWTLWNMRVLALQAQAAFDWALQHQSELKWVMCFSAGRTSGFGSPDSGDVWDALWPTIQTFGQKWRGVEVKWPAAPPDPRPGPIQSISLEIERMTDQHGYPNGWSDPPKPVPYPVRGGDVILRVRARDGRRELTTEELFQKNFWRSLYWEVSCDGQMIVAEPTGQAPWHQMTTAPFGVFGDLCETTQGLIVSASAPLGSRIRFMVRHGAGGSRMASAETPGVREV